MNKIIAFTVVFAALAASAEKLPWQEVQDVRQEIGKTMSKAPFRQRIEKLWKLLDNPRYAENAAAKYRVAEGVAGFCFMGGWINNWYFEYSLIEEYFPKIMPMILDGEYRPEEKLPFIEKFLKYYGATAKYDEGVAMVKDQLAKLKFRNPRDTAKLWTLLAEMNRYADREQDAFAACREAMKIDADVGAAKGVDCARYWDRPDREREFKAALSVAELARIASRNEQGRWNREPEGEDRDRILAFVNEPTNAPAARVAVFTRALPLDVTPEGEKAMAALKALGTNGLDRTSFTTGYTISKAFSRGSWKRAADLFELGLNCGWMKGMPDVRHRRIYVMSLFNSGRKDLAVKKALEFAAALDGDGKKAVDAAVFRVFAALWSGKDYRPAIPSALDAKTKSEIVRHAGRMAMTCSLTETAEKLAKDYEGFFAKRPDRSLAVRFCAEPVRSIADWRRVYPSLEKGLCDLRFGEDLTMADLITDVNTSRTINGKRIDDNLSAQMEVTTLCDRYALHVFLRVADRDARKVEHGFTNGITTEMYFAPGDDRPYICFGSEPLKGVTFVMNTLYESATHRPIKLARDGGSLGSEVAFTDDDYVLHVTFPWTLFYDKLPSAGKDWRFECLAWAPGGAACWAGSRGIHHSSDWGKLRFSLSAKELTEIRRELVLSAYRTWQTPPRTGANNELPYFDYWLERRIGDRDFHDRCLKDLRAKLEGYAAKVSPDMDDALVNEIYENALVDWMGLPHRIDAERKRYLRDRLVNGSF